ncbi:MAG: T9SS type A sorting domain-containing protein, partial [Melioribacteraceae bacterium]|nr:T9SS type A sorting domain-containing protein [Melioribacteraceae bacterium]
ADLDGDGTAEGLQIEVHGLMEELATYLPKSDEGLVLIQSSADFTTAVDDSLTPRIMKGGYVYFFVEEDRSFGIHNPQFTVAMLNAALNEMKGITNVNMEDGLVPEQYELSQNYPNPFNPTTTIKFSIPEASNVKVTVFDAIGREVAVLVNDQMSAGSYNVDWNAGNITSGIYLYRIESGDFTAVKKMILLK